MLAIARTSTTLALLLAACGGSSSSARKVPEGAPAWVARGSRIVGNGIVGVGSVTGIQNPPLAQDTARNRARAEISRILEVYSASLMKDFQASTTAGDMSASDEAQNVEQAIKTFSAQLVKGAEGKDMWLDPRSGAWFALVELDFERSQRIAVAGSQMGAGLSEWVEKNGERVLKGLEADLAGPPARAAPAPAGVAPLSAAPLGGSQSPGAPAAGGPRPPWVDGACDRARYLCASAEGATPAAADASARGALALIFEANIRTVAESFQSAAKEVNSRTGSAWEEVERVSEHSMVRSEKVVPMSEIEARWQAPDGRTWSLAVIDRARAAATLRDRIQGLDRSIQSQIGAAQRAPSDIERLPVLRRALGQLGERQALDADLRVLDGRGVPAPTSIPELLDLLQATSARLRFGVSLAGPGAERVRACLETALLDAGHTLEQVVVDETSATPPRLSAAADVRIEGTVRAESRGRVAGSDVIEATLTLRLINGRTGATLRTVTGSEKGSRGSREAAAATAAFKVCQNKVPSMARDIDRYFGR